MLLELEKVKPDSINMEKMARITHSEYIQLKNELNSIKILQSKPSVRPWLTEKVITELEPILLEGGSKTEQSTLIRIDSIKTSINLAEKFGVLRQENIELKKRLSPEASNHTTMKDKGIPSLDE